MGNAGNSSSVEEILASIRQAISEDDARRTQERTRMNPRTVLSRRAPAERPAPAAEPPVEEPTVESEPSAGPDQDFVERAIEQALDSVRAELEAGAPRLNQPARAQRADNAPAATPVGVAASGQQRAIPRARVAPAARAAETSVPSLRRGLLSSEVGANVSASFDELARAMFSGNARKLDEMVEEILRPMLKTWLEGNLPQMVERMVREEIERVSRGRR